MDKVRYWKEMESLDEWIGKEIVIAGFRIESEKLAVIQVGNIADYYAKNERIVRQLQRLEEVEKPRFPPAVPLKTQDGETYLFFGREELNVLNEEGGKVKNYE